MALIGTTHARFQPAALIPLSLSFISEDFWLLDYRRRAWLYYKVMAEEMGGTGGRSGMGTIKAERNERQDKKRPK